MTARFEDGGRTWGDHQVISEKNVWEDGEVWVVPQMSVLSDGRLVMVADLGDRGMNEDWPNDDLVGFGHGGPPVFIRAYLVTEEDLTRPEFR